MPCHFTKASRMTFCNVCLTTSGLKGWWGAGNEPSVVVGVKWNLEIPCHQKGREVKSLSEGWLIRGACCAERNGDQETLTVVSSDRREQRVGRKKQIQNRPGAFPKYRWGFMSTLGTRLTITNRFHKTMSQFIEVGSNRVQKGNIWLLSLSQVSWLRRGGRSTPDPIHPGPPPNRHTPFPAQVLLSF